MNLLFFGADSSWEKLKETGFSRRNTWILKTFVESKYFDSVYVVRFTTRKNVINNIFTKNKHNYVKDICLAYFFPVKFNNTFFRQINQMFFHLQFFLQAAKNFNNKKNIIWIYWANGFKMAEILDLNGRYFFDTDHNIIDDVNIDEKLKKQQEELLIRAANKCDKVVSAARSMLEWYSERGYKNTYRLRNGICLKRFKGLNKTYKQIGKPIIGYVGTLSRWIDYDMFEQIIKNNPDCVFHLYGKKYKTKAVEKISNYTNVYLKGELPAKDLPLVIKSFSLALNLYLKKTWLDVDSMKLFEYLAAGVPVVSTKFHNYLDVDFENNLYVGANYSEIQNYINNILNEKYVKKDPSLFLKKNTWKNQIEKFIKDVL